MRILFLILMSVQTMHLVAQVTWAQVNKTPLSIGETVTFFSDVMQEERKLNIYLPLSYHDSSARYPVVFLLDGALDEDMIHVTGLVQFLSFPWIEAMPESIVVGICNVDRKRDFTFPTAVEQERTDYPTTGHSARFIRFIEDELIPFVHARYQTDTISTLIGQSLGGLLAAEILFRRPALFDNYIIVSPSLWWDDGSLLEQSLDMDASKKSIFVAVGEEGQEMQQLSRELHHKISGTYSPPHRVHYTLYEELDHGNILHTAAYDAFGWIFEMSN